MNYNKSEILFKKSKTLLFVFAIIFTSLSIVNGAFALNSDKSSITTGTGKKYQTEVNRVTKGEISKDDLHQVSLLTSRVMSHVEKGVNCLRDNNIELAKENIENSLKLISIVRDMLPLTLVTTIVKDKTGKEIYKNTEQIQNDIIPLYSNMIELEVVEPLIEAKENEASLKGLRFRDSNIIYSTVLADLKYIERKVKSAKSKLAKPEEALRELILAQREGVDLKINEKDNPLIDVQKALKLAERMVEENKLEAAKYNLNIANIQLETYKNTLSEQEVQKVKKLQDEIEKVKTKLGVKGAAGSIREFWQRAVGWFKQYPGQARHTMENEKEDAMENK